MQRRNQWLVALVLISGLGVTACAPKPSAPTVEKPFHLEAIDGSKLKRVILIQKAHDRLGIETTAIREEQVTRKRRVGGEVVAAPSKSAAPASDGSVWVRVGLTEGDVSQVDQSQAARILPLNSVEGEGKDAGIEAQVDTGSANAEDADASIGTKSIYYAVKTSGHGLKVGDRMLVELTLKDGSGMHKLIPYSAVIYGVKGETWAYTNTEPLVFVRAPVTIDYIKGQLAYLSEGPATGTTVVTFGAAELYGAETGVGK